MYLSQFASAKARIAALRRLSVVTLNSSLYQLIPRNRWQQELRGSDMCDPKDLVVVCSGARAKTSEWGVHIAHHMLYARAGRFVKTQMPRSALADGP